MEQKDNNLKENNKKGKKTINKIINALTVTFAIALPGSSAINAVVTNNKVKNVDSKLVMRTNFGIPVHANLNSNKTINVVIDENFNETQKQNIKEAIQELDVDLKGVNYNILLDGSKAGKKCVKITKENYDEDNTDGLAVTDLRVNNLYGVVLFPVKISLFTDIYNDMYDDPNFDKENMSEIIKHEMLHVLGFNDVYDKEYQNKTIMYGAIDKNTTLFDLSQADKDMVNTVYKPITQDAVKVETYEPFYYPINLNMNMQDEDLSM
ncbi:MAG: hypothetical protein ACI4TT_01120 [Christensenellales bacterium]